MCVEYQRIKLQIKKWVKIFTFAYCQDQQGLIPPPPLTVSLTVKRPFFDDLVHFHSAFITYTAYDIYK